MYMKYIAPLLYYLNNNCRNLSPILLNDDFITSQENRL